MSKKVVISCGPIPARLDSVKFITNRFKGGLAFRTAETLIQRGYDTTVVIWEHTPLPHVNGQHAEFWMQDNVHVVAVKDVFDYYNWFKENAANYDAFIMAAAVANLTPSNPYEGKFPSHNYLVGEKFNIEFEIAPRAIDIIKDVNRRCCLIGYKLFDGDHEELIRAARLTRDESSANIIFANTPSEAKEKKYAVMADNSVVECSFDEHLELIIRAIEAEYFTTKVIPLTDRESQDLHIRGALATVKMFEHSFETGYGTVAVPVEGKKEMFATTSRGHAGLPVLVRSIDWDKRIIYTTGRATLNAPTLAAALANVPYGNIIVHRHEDDPRYDQTTAEAKCSEYLFPGSKEEAEVIGAAFKIGTTRIKLLGHGDIRCVPIRPVDWNAYYETFPKRYFSHSEGVLMAQRLRDWEEYLDMPISDAETLEIGGNKQVCTKYAYDNFVKAENAINLRWEEVLSKHFDCVVARNSINYFSKMELNEILARTDRFVANTFLIPPMEKVTDREAVIQHGGKMYHTLLLPDDSIIRHEFYAYTARDYESMGLHVEPYGRNSAWVIK